MTAPDGSIRADSRPHIRAPRNGCYAAPIHGHDCDVAHVNTNSCRNAMVVQIRKWVPHTPDTNLPLPIGHDPELIVFSAWLALTVRVDPAGMDTVCTLQQNI